MPGERFKPERRFKRLNLLLQPKARLSSNFSPADDLQAITESIDGAVNVTHHICKRVRVVRDRHCAGRGSRNLTEEPVGISFGKNLANSKWDCWGRISSTLPMRSIFEKCPTLRWNARGFYLIVCLWLATACVCTSAYGFALLGPYESWMQQSNGFRMPVETFGPLDAPWEPGDIGGPMCLSNGYRWNVY